ncbi:MAG TPA: hypothetical protein DEP53_18220 [Bacteroidetes bacterium]|nr:MAG: hypothetical protein A2X66_09045 [Ignavibacteria bacterium GWA2_54_16]HCA81669.1 hypothetical protein [Bacteroidota bacterium]
MAQQQEVLATILESFPVAELSTDEQRETFVAIKDRLLSAADVQEGLKTLFKVSGFSEFAAGLLWVVDRSSKLPGMAGISMEDETLLLASFRRALGEQLAQPSPAAGEGGEGRGEAAFASALERFSEAVQGGTDDRETFHVSLLGLAEGAEVQAIGGDGAEFASLLADFLKYISDNQLFDDIRVINVLSNISSSLTQWANTPPDGRAGLLEEPLTLLRDFRSQFE